MSTKTGRNRRIRTRLYKKNPHCYYCGIKTILLNLPGDCKTRPKNMATIEHLYDRLSGLREKNVEVPKTIACFRCNTTRGNMIQKLPQNIKENNKRQILGMRGKWYICLFNDLNYFDRL